MEFNTRSDTINFLNILYMNLMERLLERIIIVTDLDEERARELRRTMLKPMLFHVVEDVPLVMHEYADY
jgi:hypothetical protein